jgi:hypothetical protein
MSEAPTRPPQAPDIGRRTLTPFGYAVCIAVPILIAAGLFTFLHFHYDKEQLVSGDHLQILTSDWKAGDPGDTALVTGSLVLGDDRCLRLQTKDGGTVDLVWPADYEATVQRVGPTDQLKVYDPDRDIVARSQQSIELGGGSVPVGDYAGRTCAPASGDVFVVQSEVKVVGTAA